MTELPKVDIFSGETQATVCSFQRVRQRCTLLMHHFHEPSLEFKNHERTQMGGPLCQGASEAKNCNLENRNYS